MVSTHNYLFQNIVMPFSKWPLSNLWENLWDGLIQDFSHFDDVMVSTHNYLFQNIVMLFSKWPLSNLWENLWDGLILELYVFSLFTYEIYSGGGSSL